MFEIERYINEILPEVIQIRSKLHEIPELKYEEFKTSSLISQTLQQFGYEIQTGIGKTGIVAILDTGKPGKTIAVRADMDALPLDEPKHNKNLSQHPGVMHACGHDGHCATVLAVAYALRQIKSKLQGKVKFIFQPAEEGGKGSTAMIDAGVLKNPTVDEIYGYHNWPGLPAGLVATRVGAILVGNGSINIAIDGKPSHMAQPENAINPVIIGAELTTALNELSSNSQFKNIVLNIIAFNSGDPKKGMSNKVEIKIVYFNESENDLKNLITEIDNICTTLSNKYKTKITITPSPFHNPTINSHIEEALIHDAAKNLYGDANVLRLEKSMMAAEDFSEYLRHVPGCFFLVGTGKMTGAFHTTSFLFNDDILSVAANVFCKAIVNSLMK